MSSFALHHAVWRNDLEDVEKLLTSPKVALQDAEAESHWTPLHVALYYGHVRVAACLLEHGARIDAEDDEGRTPLEFVTKDRPLIDSCKTKTAVLSWGSGVNCQLGTGNTGLQEIPRRLEKLQHEDVIHTAASKFHSMALTKDGRVYSWGWGLGGRLGHGDPTVHTENGAQIYPRILRELHSRKIISIAAAKHHSLAVTQTGEVYSWGLNRDGRLGYTGGSSKQVTPKRIVALKGVQIVHVAAANKHSAAITASGNVYTWGSNIHGQLGYGTTDSASNPTPRCVDALNHKKVSSLSLAKKHSLALTEDGEICSWGHKSVAPKRIHLSGCRTTEERNKDGIPIHFHRGAQKFRRPLAIMVAAGSIESCCLTTTGVVFSWKSDTPHSSVYEVDLAGKKAVSISAGKTTTAAVMQDGRVYTWDLRQKGDAVRQEVVKGLRNAAVVTVGEKHQLVLQRWSVAVTPVSQSESGASNEAESEATMLSSLVSVCSEFELDEMTATAFACLSPKQPKPKKESKSLQPLQSLQLLCEKAVARTFLNPRNALQLFQLADTICASFLKSCCLQFIVHEFALILQEGHEILPSLSAPLLTEIEESYQKQILHLQSSAGKHDWWLKIGGSDTAMDSQRPTYCFHSGALPTTPSFTVLERRYSIGVRFDTNRFLPNQKSLSKLRQTVQKKLQQIKTLQQKQTEGKMLETGQLEKIAKQDIYRRALEAIEKKASYDEVQEILSENVTKTTVRKDQPTLIHSKSRSEKSVAKPTQPSPNLRPVLPKSRDIGPLPRFLEPARQQQLKQKREMQKTLDQTASQDPDPAFRERQWVTMGLTTAGKSRTGYKAIPSKETRRMSLSDFMTASTQPPPAPPPPPKEAPPPAWGGKRYPSDPSSFRSIQEEQRNRRPGMQLIGGGMKPAVERRRTVSCWQTHCDVQIQSISSIQTEEKAVQELSQLFKHATIRVKPGTAREANKNVHKS